MKDLKELAKKVDAIAESLGFSVERTVECNAFYNYRSKNAKGERLVVEIGYCENHGKGKSDLPWLWFKKGRTKEFMPEWWNVSTYVYDKDNRCYGGYNPTEKFDYNLKRGVINFDWHLSATEDNFKKLLEEVLRLFNA